MSGHATPQSLLDAALDYAAKGWDVLPLTPRGKNPITAHGLKDATANPDQVRQWWTARPTANIGVRPPAGVIVLDIDPRNGGTLDELGAIPATAAVATGSGGWHLYFTFRGKTRGTLAGVAGIDIKTHTGYLVAPPSIHPNGQPYTWASLAAISPLPAHLAARVMPPEPTRAVTVNYSGPTSARGLIRTVQTAPQGERNNALHWAACRAADEGAGDAVFDQLADAATAAGLDAGEIGRTIQSARSAREAIKQ